MLERYTWKVLPSELRGPCIEDILLRATIMSCVTDVSSEKLIRVKSSDPKRNLVRPM